MEQLRVLPRDIPWYFFKTDDSYSLREARLCWKPASGIDVFLANDESITTADDLDLRARSNHGAIVSVLTYRLR